VSPRCRAVGAEPDIDAAPPHLEQAMGTDVIVVEGAVTDRRPVLHVEVHLVLGQKHRVGACMAVERAEALEILGWPLANVGQRIVDS